MVEILPRVSVVWVQELSLHATCVGRDIGNSSSPSYLIGLHGVCVVLLVRINFSNCRMS